MGNYADGHLSRWIDRTSADSAAAEIDIVGVLASTLGLRKVMFRQAHVFFSAFWIVIIESDNFFRAEPDGKRTGRAVSTWINERIKLEFDTEILFRKPFHFVDFVAVYGGGNGFQL